MTLLLLAVGLYTSTLIVAIIQTGRFSNEGEALRVRTGITFALNDKVADFSRQISFLTNNDQAARAIYSAQVDWTYVEQVWRKPLQREMNLEKLFVTDANLRPLEGQAKLAPFGTNDPVRRTAAILSSRLSSTKSHDAAFVRSTQEPLLVVVALVRPLKSATNSKALESAPHRAIFVLPLPARIVDEFGDWLQLSDLHTSTAADSINTAPIYDVDGREAGAIKWTSLHSRWEALAGMLPLLGLLLISAVLASILLIRSVLSKVTDLDEQVSIDPLSGLNNRRALYQALDAAAAKKEEVAVALADLDGFKLVNDMYGHDVGDALITFFAAEMKHRVDEQSMAVRLGGDEFAFLVVGKGAAEKLESVVRGILQRLHEPVHVEGRSLDAASSFGLALADFSQIEPTEALRRADVALYVSKRAGKRRSTWFSEEHDDEHAEEQSLSRDLRIAVDERQFSVVYQPVYSAKGEVIESLEALVRWTSPERGAVSPATFIPIADKTGLITKIQAQVLEIVAQDSLNWRDIPVAINMSVAQVRQPDFVRTLRDKIKEVGLSHSQIEIEISESLFLQNQVQSIKVARQLRAMGIDLSLDDFGSGAGALNALRRGGFSRVKLDGGLVREAGKSEIAMATLHSCISLAHALGLRVVAEGVETEVQATVMRAAGCDGLQGWYFGKALPGGAITARLLKQKDARAA